MSATEFTVPFHRISETLEKQGMIVSVPVGTSMWPMLRNRKDHIVIRKATAPLKRYDVPLYQRTNGKLVLHRILDITPEGYVLCGDNQFQKEYGVKQEQILGVLTAFYRGDKMIDCVSDKKYLRYVKVWCLSVKLRIPVFIMRKCIGRLKRGWKQ